MSNLRTPYIKPTRHVHDSGYRTFEVGYYTIGEDKRAAKIEVIGEYSDHIFTDYMVLVGKNKPFSLNMDLTLDGYIRLWSYQGDLVWDSEHAYSSMGLKLVEKTSD